ncbi:PEP-CTERM sorting domain-containing protein [Nostoc sp. ChiQUE01b]|uniref:PEP-CTERM sorting domain-containing protein n=1 Tax=Nostoc sp. ChiQUE01b TaxID=3075376 RepID=UPI002AD30929|nr:PEP-CTERM sorting domain-containing protein [Nostoc sp. ChiQUE01b]MDZ8259080.1 PEP-CTERM sorting domain-containing protein [Nostoc sp. ChiQUE01b]
MTIFQVKNKLRKAFLGRTLTGFILKNRFQKKLPIVSAGGVITAILLGTITSAKAAEISFSPGDGVPPVVVSPPFGELASGGEVGTAFINKGVDFSFGGREGIFNDPPLAFGGVNSSNNVDLISPVDGRIVLPGTLNNGLTSFLSIEAGASNPGQLLLEVFDAGGALLSSVANNLPLGPNGRTTLTIDRGGIFDIASFKVSTPVNDAFGVNFIKLETPMAADSQSVPEPSTILSLLTVGAIGVALRCKRQQQEKETAKV